MHITRLVFFCVRQNAETVLCLATRSTAMSVKLPREPGAVGQHTDIKRGSNDALELTDLTADSGTSKLS
jgi:hypothetical protein